MAGLTSTLQLAGKERRYGRLTLESDSAQLELYDAGLNPGKAVDNLQGRTVW
jgi:hypothetical protein